MIPDAIREGDDTTPMPAPLLAGQNPRLVAGEGVDLVLLAAVLVLLCIGTVEIYSASAVNAGMKMGSPTYFLMRHLVYLGMGFFAMFVAVRTDFSILRRFTYPLLGGALFMMVAVLFVGHRVGGAVRWLALGPLSFQPVEIAKLALVCYLANSLARKREKVRTFTVGFMPHLAVCGLMMVLLLKQPDLGSSLILGATTLIMLFIAGTKLSYILLAVMAAAPIVYQAVVGTPWRLKRMIAFIDPWQFREGVGYQITESLISIGSGGWTGLGLGDGKQKLFYMPEAHNDFIMSNIGEELGFVGFIVVLSCYGLILWRGVRAALHARDAFGTFLAFGLTSIFCLQALVNTGVVLGALPAKGLTLPFVSYGGTSLIMAMFFAGVILNVSKRAPAPAVHRVKRIKNDNKRRRRVRVAARTHGSSVSA